MHELLTSIRLAFNNLRSNIGRTLISLTGIVIGVVAVVLVISLGAGLREYVVGQVESFGSDIIEIEIKVPGTEQASGENAGGQVGGTQITTFKIADAEKVADHPNLNDWYAGGLGQAVVSYGGKNKQTMIFGVTAGIEVVDDNFTLAEGQMYSAEDDQSLKQVVVLGSKIKEDLFGAVDVIGKDLKIKDQNYKVVGMLEPRGSMAFFDWDEIVYVPARTLQKKIQGIDHITFAVFQVKDMNQVELTALEMEAIMRQEHDIDDPRDDDFAVMSIAEATEMVDEVLTIINIMLLALTSISLVVGGVGITNVMYVAVAERTFEIGLRKAVGANRGDILKQFLFEAIFITLAGGLMGIVIGFGLAKTAEIVSARYGFFLNFPLTFNAVFISLIFVSVVGLIFGLRPAQSAARLSPMEALRKE